MNGSRSNRSYQSEDDDYHAILGQIHQERNLKSPSGISASHESRKRLFSTLRKRSVGHAAVPQQVRAVTTSDSAPYNQSALGLPQYQQPATNQPKNISINLTIQKPTLKSFRRKITSKKRFLRPAVLVAFACVLLFAGVTGLKAVLKKDEPGQVAGAFITPKRVFLPQPLPDGFSIGSSSQELDNGAVLYSVYGPDGDAITLTQQMKATDFDESVLKGGLRFTTDYGSAHILTSNERVTGYLFGEDTWVLLSADKSTSSLELQKLMSSLQPSNQDL